MVYKSTIQQRKYRREYMREWRKRNPECDREYTRRYRLRNPEKCKIIAEKSRLRHLDTGRRCSLKSKSKRRGMIDAIKLKYGCADCGYNEHACALDFDHVRGKKLFAIASYITLAWPRIEKEIAKCEVVCANCHRIRTAQRRKKKSGGKHGRIM